MSTVEWSFSASDSLESSSPDENDLLDLDLSTLSDFALDIPLVLPTRRKRVNRRRNEIEQLRVEAAKLEAEIDELQRRQSRQNPVPVSAREVLGVAWQRMATGQFEQRRRVEGENRKLKDMVREQKRAMRSLRRHFATYACPQWACPHGSAQPSHSHMPVDPPSFTFVTAGIYQMLTLTDSVMADPRLKMLSTAFRDVKVDPCGPNGLAVQTLDSRLVPFDVASTGAAVLQHLMGDSGPAPCNWIETSDDLLLAEVITSVDAGRFKGYGHAKMAMSCIEDSQRVVIARVIVFSKLEGVATDGFLQLPLRHCHWVVVERPCAVDPLAGGGEYCQIKSSSLCLVDLAAAVVKDVPSKQTGDIITKICIDLSTARLDQMHEGVDNQLLGIPLRAEAL